jgi:hypothetical protein
MMSRKENKKLRKLINQGLPDIAFSPGSFA